MQDRELLIEVKDLCKSYGDHMVLENLNTNIYRGEVIAIVGPSGCGKSTFLRSLNLLEHPEAGQIIFEGTDLLDKKTNINEVRQKIGMVFQQFNLFPNMTVKENIMLAPMKLKNVSKEDASNEAMRLLERVGLSEKADAYHKEELRHVEKDHKSVFDGRIDARRGCDGGGRERHIQRRGHGLRWNDCRRCDARKRRDHGD